MNKELLKIIGILVCVAGATVFLWKYGDVICEEDPTICDDYEEPDYYNPLIPIGGLTLLMLIVLGIIGLVKKGEKDREKKD